jgi:hypothetical protein
VALGKNGRNRSICSSVSQNRSLIPVSSRSLNQIATLASMGPDPRAIVSFDRAYVPDERASFFEIVPLIRPPIQRAKVGEKNKLGRLS